MLRTVPFGAFILVASLVVGCGNKNHERCLADAAAYEKAKIECLAKGDKKEQQACVDANEVKKITPADCDASYK